MDTESFFFLKGAWTAVVQLHWKLQKPKQKQTIFAAHWPKKHILGTWETFINWLKKEHNMRPLRKSSIWSKWITDGSGQTWFLDALKQWNWSEKISFISHVSVFLQAELQTALKMEFHCTSCEFHLRAVHNELYSTSYSSGFTHSKIKLLCWPQTPRIIISIHRAVARRSWSWEVEESNSLTSCPFTSVPLDTSLWSLKILFKHDSVLLEV